MGFHRAVNWALASNGSQLEAQRLERRSVQKARMLSASKDSVVLAHQQNNVRSFWEPGDGFFDQVSPRLRDEDAGMVMHASDDSRRRRLDVFQKLVDAGVELPPISENLPGQFWVTVWSVREWRTQIVEEVTLPTTVIPFSRQGESEPEFAMTYPERRLARPRSGFDIIEAEERALGRGGSVHDVGCGTPSNSDF